MDWLVLAFALELGMAPLDQAIMYGPPDRIVEESPVYYAELQARVTLFDLLFVGGGVETQMWNSEQRFWPFRAAYLWEAGLQWKMLEAGYRWYCTHPVMPMQPLALSEPRWEGAYGQIYVRIAGSTKSGTRPLRRHM